MITVLKSILTNLKLVWSFVVGLAACPQRRICAHSTRKHWACLYAFRVSITCKLLSQFTRKGSDDARHIKTRLPFDAPANDSPIDTLVTTVTLLHLSHSLCFVDRDRTLSLLPLFNQTPISCSLAQHFLVFTISLEPKCHRARYCFRAMKV